MSASLATELPSTLAPAGLIARRGGARLLDLVGAASVLAAPIGIGLVIPGFHDLPVVIGGALGVVAAIAFAVWNLYRTATDGTTFGKRAMGLKIVRDDGTAPGFLHGVVERVWMLGLGDSILMALTGMPVPFLTILNAMLVFQEDGKALHDHIAGTRVVGA
ncbi:MAG: RDD family protein [Alphaproteobacteria bacterium]|nr:RDD family protein [Alphaproteobacteria bacterium]